MLVLALDTTTRGGSVAVSRDGHVLDLSGHLVHSVLELVQDPMAMTRTRRALEAFSAHGPRVDELTLLPPVTEGRKILCIGQNYADHCAEQNKALPERPILFSKFTTCLIGHGMDIVVPSSLACFSEENS